MYIKCRNICLIRCLIATSILCLEMILAAMNAFVGPSIHRLMRDSEHSSPRRKFFECRNRRKISIFDSVAVFRRASRQDSRPQQIPMNRLVGYGSSLIDHLICRLCGLSVWFNHVSTISLGLLVCFLERAEVSFDARRQLCLPERRRAFQRLAQILNPFLFFPGPDVGRAQSVSEAGSLLVFRR